MKQLFLRFIISSSILCLFCQKQPTAVEPLPAPEQLEIKALTDQKVQLNWRFEGEVEGFYLKKSKAFEGFVALGVANANQRTFVDTTGVKIGELYTYRVSAFNRRTESAVLEKDFIFTAFPAPTNFSIKMVTEQKAKLTWQDNSDFEAGFVIRRKQRSGIARVIGKVPANATTFSDSTLPSAAQFLSFTYQVAAFSALNESISSEHGIYAASPYNEIASLNYPGHVYWVTFSPDSRFLTSGHEGAAIPIWRTSDWGQETSLAASFGAEARYVDFSGDGQYFAWAGRYTNIGLRIWRTANWGIYKDLNSPVYDLNCVVLNPDGKLLAFSENTNRSVQVFRTADWSKAAAFNYEITSQSMKFSPDGKYLAVATTNHVYIYDTATWNLITRLGKHTMTVGRIQVSPDSRYLVVGGGSQDFWVWRASNWSLVGKFSVNGYSVKGLAFSPDNRFLVTAEDFGTLIIWRTADWGRETVLPDDSVNLTSLAISPDSKFLATGHLYSAYSQKRIVIREWNSNWHWVVNR